MEIDWAAAARAFAPDIPATELDRVLTPLKRLEQAVRPVLSGLPLELPPATDVEPQP